MVTVDPGSGSDAVQRRRTWVLGGALLVASALTRLAAQGPLASLYRAVDVLFVAGSLVLVIGLGRAGSVTARRPLGTGAVIALALVLLGAPFAWDALLRDADGYGSGQLIGASVLLTMVQAVVTLMLAIIAVVQIGRAGVIPRPWNWAPLWALGVVVATRLLAMVPLSPLLPDPADASVALFVTGLLGVINTAAIAFLGIVAIVRGTRTEPGSVAVYSSNAG